MAVTAIGFVVVAVLWQVLWLGWPATLLSVGLVACLAFWWHGRWGWTPRLRPAGGAALAVFVSHATEEWLGGLPRSLPALLGRPGWSDGRYLVFNATWLAVFVVALAAAKPGRRLPLLPLLFLAVVGGIANGVLHLALVVQQGGYFPGAWTALPSFAAGLLLLRAMRPGSRLAN